MCGTAFQEMSDVVDVFLLLPHVFYERCPVHIFKHDILPCLRTSTRCTTIPSTSVILEKSSQYTLRYLQQTVDEAVNAIRTIA